MEKKDKCCTPKGQVPRYVDCIGCDKKPIETMSKQTAVELLEQQLKERYSLMNSEPLFEQAKKMEKEEQEQTWNIAWEECSKFDTCKNKYNGGFEQYYNETYGETKN
jgi:hypothetical protein